MTLKIKIYLALFIFLSTIGTLTAQKKKELKTSTFSNTIKVDGKLNDWPGNSFHSDKNTLLSYAVANDEKHLYISIKKDKNPSKIFNGGITFFIMKGNSPKLENAILLTYPVTNTGNKGNIDLGIIKVSGISAITDSLISVYNESGIRINLKSETVDSKLCTCLEMAMPLDIVRDYLDANNISFGIRLNGTPHRSGGGAELMANSRSIGSQSRENLEMLHDIMVPTEFFTTIQIAKKPK